MNIVVFLPLGQSLEGLRDSGQLFRFENYYLRKYRANFQKVHVVSYGYDNPNLKGISVFNNQWQIHRYLWQFLVPIVFRKSLSGAILRVMQLDGLLPALISKWLNGGKVVVTYGYDYKKFAAIDQKILQSILYLVYEYLLLPFADKIIVPNPSKQKELSSHPFLSKKTVYLPNGVDTKIFSPLSYKQQRQSQKVAILSVGRLEKQKNYPFLIRCLAKQKLSSKAGLTLIGTGTQAKLLQKKAKSTGLTLQLVGNIPNEKIVDYYRDCDIYAQPSLIEGSPKTVLEAMACGCPVLVSRSPGNVDVVNDKTDGLVADLTEKDFGQKLEFLITDQKLRHRLSQKARQTVEKNYSLDRVLSDEVALLKKPV